MAISAKAIKLTQTFKLTVKGGEPSTTPGQKTPSVTIKRATGGTEYIKLGTDNIGYGTLFEGDAVFAAAPGQFNVNSVGVAGLDNIMHLNQIDILIEGGFANPTHDTDVTINIGQVSGGATGN